MSLIRKQPLKSIQKCPGDLKQVCSKIYQETGISITFSKLLLQRYDNNQLQQNLRKMLEDFQSLLEKMRIEYVIFSPESIQFCIEENQQLKNYYQKYNQQNPLLWEKIAVKIDNHKISYTNKVSIQRHLIINYHYGKRFYQLLQNEAKRLSVKFKLATDHSYKNKITFMDIQKVLTVLNNYQKADIPTEIKRINLTYNSYHHSDSFKLIQIPVSGSSEQIKKHFDQIIEDLKTIKSLKISIPELYSKSSSISQQKDNLFKEINLKAFIKENGIDTKYFLINSNKKEITFTAENCSFDLQLFSLDELTEIMKISNSADCRSIFSGINNTNFKLHFVNIEQIGLPKISYIIHTINSIFSNLDLHDLPFHQLEFGSNPTRTQDIIKLLDDKNIPIPETINIDALDDQNEIQMIILSVLKIHKNRNKSGFFDKWNNLKIVNKNKSRKMINEVFFSPVK